MLFAILAAKEALRAHAIGLVARPSTAMSRDASEQLEALYHNLGFWSRGFHLHACWQEYNRKSSGVERKRIRVYPASGDDELSLHPLCLGCPKPARPSRGRISATRAFIIRMRKPYGV